MDPKGSSQNRRNTPSSVLKDTETCCIRPLSGVRLINKHEASNILGISPETLKKYRLQKNSTLIEGIHYHIWNTRVVKYNAVLITDWGLNRNSPETHQRTIEAYLTALPSNQPKKRGRRVG